MALLDPAPHFPVTTAVQDSEEKHVARIVVPSEELAAVFDGLVITNGGGRYAAPLTELLAAAIHSMTLDMASDIGDDGWATTVRGAGDLSATATRLPLATRLLQSRMVAAECEPSDAEREGWAAYIREMFVGKIAGFQITGKERDALVHVARRRLAETEDGGSKRDLRAILRDTGTKKGTGEACTITSLPMPTLVEWLRVFLEGGWGKSHHLPKKERKRHARISGMFWRLRREIEAGPPRVIGSDNSDEEIIDAELADTLAAVRRLKARRLLPESADLAVSAFADVLAHHVEMSEQRK